MPWGDVEFWIVSIVALGALTLVVRTLLPRKHSTKTKVSLTIEREKPE